MGDEQAGRIFRNRVQYLDAQGVLLTWENAMIWVWDQQENGEDYFPLALSSKGDSSVGVI